MIQLFKLMGSPNVSDGAVSQKNMTVILELCPLSGVEF
jgi:hypothetical protein